MAQTIPLESLSERLGTGLGTGIASGLEQLLQEHQRRQQVAAARQQQASGLQALGFTPDQALQIAALDPKIQEQVVKQRLAAPGQQLYTQQLSQLLGGVQPTIEGAAQPDTLSELIGKPGLTQQQMESLTRLGLEKEKMSRKEQMEALKETKTYRREVAQNMKKAKELNINLSRLEELVKKGNLHTPAWEKLLADLNLQIGTLSNPDSEEFRKLVKDFMAGASKMFGGRVTNFEMSQFMQRLPSLLQSDEGKLRIIRFLRMTNDLRKKEFDIMQEMYEKYKNKPLELLTLEEKVSERLADEIDAYEQEFLRASGIPDESKVKKLIDKETGQVGYYLDPATNTWVAAAEWKGEK